MPSLDHEIPIELVRNRPELVRELCEAIGIAFPEGAIELISAELAEVTPTEYRADAAIAIRGGGTTCGVVVEVQRSQDEDKRYVWPVYVTTLRARLRAPVMLLVLATTEAVARWARNSIETGHPAFAFQPIVISFSMIPRVIDPGLAARSPELAVLSAIAHPGDLEVGRAALDAISGLPNDTFTLYSDVIENAHPQFAKLFLEGYMKGYEYQGEVVKRFVLQGREEGREEVVLELARAKLSSLSPHDEQRIRTLAGSELTKLGVALARAKDETEARAILAHLTTPGT